ncbi:hypothetical protein [Celeribacter sp.]|uniref:hypothetical protein n=1 Tax=Celeribacter sp. TaxID=1890673 RepID=UPI003A915DC5
MMDQINGALLFKILIAFFALGGVGYLVALAPKWVWAVLGGVVVLAVAYGFWASDTRGVALFYLIVGVPMALPAFGIGALFGIAKRRRETDHGGHS